MRTSQTISPEKHDWLKEEGLSSLPEGEWAVAESQRGMTQDEVKILCQGATPWKTGIFMRGRVELFSRGWVNCCWVPKRDDAGWSENCMSWCNALKNGHLPERKGWALYRRVSELLLSPKERWQGARRMTARQTKKMEKESIKMFCATRKFFHSQVKLTQTVTLTQLV